MIAFAGALFTSIALVLGFGLLGVGADLANSQLTFGLREAALVHRMYSKLIASTFTTGLVVLIGATGVAVFGWQVFPSKIGRSGIYRQLAPELTQTCYGRSRRQAERWRLGA